MSNIILAVVVFFMILMAILLFCIVIFAGAVLIFSGKGREAKEKTAKEKAGGLAQGPRVVEHKMI